MLLIAIAYIFSLSLRFIWVYHFNDMQSFTVNDQFMVTTNDSYHFAKGTQDIIEGVAPQDRYKASTTALSQMTAFIAKIFPFISFETLIFYMPAFVASLLVVPIILIGHSLNNLKAGFIAALVGSIAVSYYNRTMVGYYDTDMLNIVLPTLLLWSLIAAFATNKNIFLLIVALDALIYRWWYPQSYALEFAFAFIIAVYGVYKLYKKEDIRYYLQLLSLFLIAVMMAPEWLRFLAIVVLYLLFIKKDFTQKIYYYITAAIFVLFYLLGGLDPIISQLQSYVFRDSVATDSRYGIELHFFTTMQTVREAGAIPFTVFADRISGHIVTFILSILGYLYLCYKHPVMLLSLPMVGLGFLAYGIPGVVDPGGLRFTIYAVAILALGFGFFVVQLSKYIKKQMLANTVMVALVLIALIPNIAHINEYKVPTVFNANEVEVLQALKQVSNKDDYTVAWWDYGYPIAYYSDTQTLIDGGRHAGRANFLVSYILTSPEEKAAQMARLSTHYDPKSSRVFEYMMVQNGYSDSNEFLKNIMDIKLPQPKSDTYIYLPLRMSGIYPVISRFSSLDLMSGQKRDREFFYESSFMQSSGDYVDFGNGVVLNRSNAMIELPNTQIPVRRFIQTSLSDSGTEVHTQDLRSEGVTVIVAGSYNKVLVIDESIYNSLYIQHFFLDNYDKSLYKKVIDSPVAKVFKLKV